MAGEHRNWGLASRQTVLLMVAVTVLVIAASIFFRPAAPRQGTGQYFYDLGSQQLYATGADALPPQPAPSGDVGVLALVYSCSSCDDSSSHRIAYLQKYTDEYRRQRATRLPPQIGSEIDGTLIRAVDGDQWFVSSSEQATALTGQMQSACAGATPTLCLPGATR